MAHDELGDRMKQYEAAAKVQLPPRCFTVVRVDGRAFHTWTRGLSRPFDADLAEDLTAAAASVAAGMGGCLVAYAQSDEVTFVLSDLGSTTTQPFFGGVAQKIASVTASEMTAAFLTRRLERARPGERPATFDARAFTVPSAVEAANALVWRQADARRNAMQALGRHVLGHRAMHQVPNRDVPARLLEAGVQLAEYPTQFWFGTLITRQTVTELAPWRGPDAPGELREVERSRWVCEPAPEFLRSDRLAELLPDAPAVPRWGTRAEAALTS